jgi:hypothetical protein
VVINDLGVQPSTQCGLPHQCLVHRQEPRKFFRPKLALEQQVGAIVVRARRRHRLGADRQDRNGRLSDDRLGHAAEEPAPRSAPAVGGHDDQVAKLRLVVEVAEEVWG